MTFRTLSKFPSGVLAEAFRRFKEMESPSCFTSLETLRSTIRVGNCPPTAARGAMSNPAHSPSSSSPHAMSLSGFQSVLPRHEMRRQRLLQRPAKKCLQHFLQRAVPGLRFCLTWKINNFPPLSAPLQIRFSLKNMHHASHSHRRRRIRYRFDNLIHCRLPQCKNSIHNLTLTTTQFRRIRFRFFHDALNF
jgi:hypothetical protein